MDDTRRAAAAGFGLTILLAALYGLLEGFDGTVFGLFVLRWLHVLCGVMWVGLSWYFALVHVPAMTQAPGKAASTQIVAAALFWLRWGAMGAFVSGLFLAFASGYLGAAYTLDFSEGLAGWPVTPGTVAIGIGMWLASIMWFNTWFIVWPSRKRALAEGRFAGLTADERLAALQTACAFHRVNALLAIPMLFSMLAAEHLY